MKRLIILFFSIVMAGEMEVDGNLTVTDTLIVNNRDVITTIDSLQQQISSLLVLIAQLEMRIAQLECQNTGIIPDGYCDCFFHTLDLCGVCNGDDITCQDCTGVPNGDNLEDNCGVCDSDSSNDCLQDCFGEWGGTAIEDVCGDCGGDAISEDECIDYALSFDGVDDYVNINPEFSFSTNEGFSVSAWVISSLNKPGEYFIDFDDEEGRRFTVYKHWAGTEGVQFSLGGGCAAVLSDYSILSGQWFYITGVLDIINNQTHLYINGDYITSTGCGGINNFYMEGGSSKLNIGATHNLYGSQFTQGNISSAEIWQRVLSQEEIQSYMSTPPTGNEEGLVGYWNFNAGSGNILYDHSGNGNHGTIHGATWVERE